MEVGLVGAVSVPRAATGCASCWSTSGRKGPRYQRQMLWGILAVWLLVMIPGAYFMLERTVSTMFGGS